MQLVEQHCISKSDPRSAISDEAAFKSKNLYNAANDEIRQAFIHEGKYLNSNEVQRRMQDHETDKALPAKVSQQVLLVLDKNWKGFREALKAYDEDSSTFLGRPRLRKYKHKTEGRNILVDTIQAMSRGKDGLKRGIIKPSMLAISVRTQHKDVDQVRIVPRKGFYVVEVVDEHEQPKSAGDPARCAGIDIGMDNLAAFASNLPGFVPVLINGRPLKSLNHYYNKRRAEYQQCLRHPGTTKRLEWLTAKRTRRIDQSLHTASRFVIDLLVAYGIGTLIIGKNDHWKQASPMSAKTNQNVVNLPHARFLSMLTYKAELVGIGVILTEESYTSKASFLDRDPLPVYTKSEKSEHQFSGTRIKRGLYQAKDGRLVNADLNGAGNIVRKVVPNAFGSQGIEDGESRVHLPVVHPVRLSFPVQSPKIVRVE